MLISKEELVTKLAPLLKSAGFKKKAATWRRHQVDGVQVVNVQGSQWGPEYYLNLGFYLRELGDEEEPPEYRCHVRARVLQPDRAASTLVVEIEAWFGVNGSVGALGQRLAENRLPAMTSALARDLLEQRSAPSAALGGTKQTTGALPSDA